MGVRDSLNQQNPKVVGVAVIVAVMVSLFMIFRSSGDGGGGEGGMTMAFFSTDDGKTWFPDDARKVPPLNIDGKNAYRAYVYQCPEGRKFVAFLERYTPGAKKRREALYAGGETNAAPILDEAKGIFVKAPGQAIWIKQSDPKAAAIMTPKCAGGGNAQMVLP